MIYFILALIILAIDQGTKWLVVRYMDIGQSIPLIEEVFYLTSHRNAGAAFGILQDQRWFFIVITIVVVVGVSYYIWKFKHENKLFIWSLAFILGGALGNFVDRLLTGEVVDFLDVKIHIGNFFYDYPIFNVADMALVVGVGLLLIDTIRETLQERREKKEELAVRDQNDDQES